MHAFCQGICERCNVEIFTGHTPGDKLCENCSDQYNACKECGAELENEMPKLVCGVRQNLIAKQEIKFDEFTILKGELCVVDNIVGYGFNILTKKDNKLLRVLNSQLLLYFDLEK